MRGGFHSACCAFGVHHNFSSNILFRASIITNERTILFIESREKCSLCWRTCPISASYGMQQIANNRSSVYIPKTLLFSINPFPSRSESGPGLYVRLGKGLEARSGERAPSPMSLSLRLRVPVSRRFASIRRVAGCGARALAAAAAP